MFVSDSTITPRPVSKSITIITRESVSSRSLLRMSVPASGRPSPRKPSEFSLGMKKSKATTPRPGWGFTSK